MAEKKLKRCVIISGGFCSDTDFIKNYISEDDYIICADKGYEYAKICGIKPDLAVGDFDSYQGDLDNAQVISLDTHKDDTDTEHCAKIAIHKGFKEVVLLCALGGRNDHTYSNFITLNYLCKNKVDSKIVSPNEIIEIKSKGKHIYKNKKGKTFSVFPFGCSDAIVSYIGECEYPLKNKKIDASLSLGISNIFLSDNVTIEVKKGTIIIFIENKID